MPGTGNYPRAPMMDDEEKLLTQLRTSADRVGGPGKQSDIIYNFEDMVVPTKKLSKKPSRLLEEEPLGMAGVRG